MGLREFDVHLDNYIKVMQIKVVTLKIFYKQYTFCFYKTDPDFLKRYKYFKQNSRHLKYHNQLEFANKGMVTCPA